MSRQGLLQTYRDVKRLHAEVHDRLAYLETDIKQMDPSLVIDAVYALKQSVKYLEDCRKEMGRVIDLASRIGCALVVNSETNTLSGHWASGYAQPGEQPAVPHPDREPEQYAELMQALGASADLINAGTMRPSFDAIYGWMEKLNEEGKPIPAAFRHVRMIPRYTVVARSKTRAGLDEATA